MWSIIQRVILPLLLLAAGASSLLYGMRSHTEQVYEEREIEIALAPPPLPPPDFNAPPGFDALPGFDGPPGMGGMPDFAGAAGPMPPFGALPPELQKVKQKIFISNDEPETTLVRDVTIGGLRLLDSGELQRTYSGKPPSLCPT